MDNIQGVPKKSDFIDVDWPTYDLIEQFRNDPEQTELEIVAKSKRRAAAHIMCVAFGLHHRSTGYGKERKLVIRKTAPSTNSYRFDHALGAWSEVTDEVLATLVKPAELTHLSLLTFNVLFDMHDPETNELSFRDLIYTDMRRKVIFEKLGEANKDIYVLQEITPDFLEELLNQEWVRNSYYLDNIDPEKLNPGNIMLSRYPIDKVMHFSLKNTSKTASVNTMTINNEEIAIAAIHLKAGAQDLYGFVRRRQINEIVATMTYLNCPTSILAGDFNLRMGEVIEDHVKYNDVWSTVHPDNPDEPTYNVHTNDLAMQISTRIRAHRQDGSKPIADRFDRVMLNFRSHWRPQSIELFGTESIGKAPNHDFNLFMSDHFGLSTVLEFVPKPCT